jgi:hypothetical protein
MRFIGWIALIAGLACATFGAVAYLGQKGEGITLLAVGGVVAVVGLILGAMGGKGQPARAGAGGSVVHHHHHDDRYGHDHHHHDDDEHRREEAEAEAPSDDGGGGGDGGGGDDE